MDSGRKCSTIIKNLHTLQQAHVSFGFLIVDVQCLTYQKQ